MTLKPSIADAEEVVDMSGQMIKERTVKMALIEQKAAVSAVSDLLMHQLKGERLPTWNEVYHAIHNLTPVDAVPVVHGYWRIGDRSNVYGGREIICSQCGESFMVSPKTLEYLSDCERFCCRCGAKMDGKDDNGRTD